ncbi:hypothetical protein VNO77_41037 [Canavalia gladiata]|uniref:Zinc finger LSD1-type domain-containing protein n=1 Tax=Canavalia gladiata TaxID=3824 RepID=A0AAN9JYZ9_CANGL
MYLSPRVVIVTPTRSREQYGVKAGDAERNTGEIRWCGNRCSRDSLCVPLAPYPTPPPLPSAYTPSPNGAKSQLVCSGCTNLLLYPIGATSVCCAVCNAITAVPLPGTEMAQLICGGCHIFLMYIRGATNVQCSCCHTINLALEANQVAHVNCGNCRMLLMYQYGARSVKCAVCSFVTSVGASTSITEQKFSI